MRTSPMKTGLVTTITTTTTMHWVRTSRARTPMVKKTLTRKACTATVRATTPLRTMTKTTWTNQMTTMVIWMRAEVSVYAAAVVVL